MVLHVHKDITVSMNPRDVASEFAGYQEHRLRILSRLCAMSKC